MHSAQQKLRDSGSQGCATRGDIVNHNCGNWVADVVIRNGSYPKCVVGSIFSISGPERFRASRGPLVNEPMRDWVPGPGQVSRNQGQRVKPPRLDGRVPRRNGDQDRLLVTCGHTQLQLPDRTSKECGQHTGELRDLVVFVPVNHCVNRWPVPVCDRQGYSKVFGQPVKTQIPHSMGAATDLVTAGGAQKGAQFLTADTFSCENEVTELGCKLWRNCHMGYVY